MRAPRLITRGLAEMTRFGVALGARADTFMGLSGLGDLVLTATGDLSRNRKVGLLLAQGRTLAQAVDSLGHVAEGVYCARTVVQRARHLGVEMPIADSVVALLDGRVRPAEAVAELIAGGVSPASNQSEQNGRHSSIFPPARVAELAQADAARALHEDVGDGDLTAGLVPAGVRATARVLLREPAVLCGAPWVEAVVRQLEPQAAHHVAWCAKAHSCAADQTVLEIAGDARALLTAERTALNFLQLLSAVATRTATYVEAVRGTRAAIVDTRKTLPGLRLAQKYAVRAGGGTNHRIGLYDAILIKENHIAAAGGVSAALQAAARGGRRRRSSSRSRSRRWPSSTRRWPPAPAWCCWTTWTCPPCAKPCACNDAAAAPCSKSPAASRSRACAPWPRPASTASRSVH